MAFYPLIIIFWRVPKFLILKGNWYLNIGLFNALVSGIQSARYTFVTTTLFSIAVAISMFSEFTAALYLSLGTLPILLLLTTWRSFTAAFSQSKSHYVFLKLREFWQTKRDSAFLLDEDCREKSLTDLNEKQLLAWTNNLQQAVLINRMCLFLAKRLRDYENAGFHWISLLAKTIALLIYSCVIFFAMNYSLYKIDPTQYKLLSGPGTFQFFFYAFAKLLPGAESSVTATAIASQCLLMFESIFAFVLIGFFFTTAVAEAKQKHSQSLKVVIDSLIEEGDLVEKQIVTQYRFSDIDEALVKLAQLKSNMLAFILLLTANLKK